MAIDYNAKPYHAVTKVTCMLGLAIAGIALTLESGCSRAAPASMATNEVASPVYQLADSVKHAQKFRNLFASGAAPKDEQRKRFGEYAFQVSRIKPVSESEAVLNVELDDGKADRAVEVEWTVVKEGVKWKLKAAPLP